MPEQEPARFRRDSEPNRFYLRKQEGRPGARNSPRKKAVPTPQDHVWRLRVVAQFWVSQRIEGPELKVLVGFAAFGGAVGGMPVPCT
jgi:hypothetical protein